MSTKGNIPKSVIKKAVTANRKNKAIPLDIYNNIQLELMLNALTECIKTIPIGHLTELQKFWLQTILDYSGFVMEDMYSTYETRGGDE